MNREEIKTIVTNNYAKPYRANLIGGELERPLRGLGNVEACRA